MAGLRPKLANAQSEQNSKRTNITARRKEKRELENIKQLTGSLLLSIPLTAVVLPKRTRIERAERVSLSWT